MTYSKRPLKIDEVVDAIAVDTEGDEYFNETHRMFDPGEISRYCSSLVVVESAKDRSYNMDDESAELQLAHLSVKEYLTSDRLDIHIAEHFQQVVAKASISTVCLAYLMHLDFHLPTDELRKSFPFAQYCAKYWIKFAAVAESSFS